MWFGAPCVRPRTCIQRVTTGDHYVRRYHGRLRETTGHGFGTPAITHSPMGDHGRPRETDGHGVGARASTNSYAFVIPRETTKGHGRPRETTGDHPRETTGHGFGARTNTHPHTGDHGRPRDTAGDHGRPIWDPDKHTFAYGRPPETTGDHGSLILGPGQAHSNTGDHARLRETTLH